MNQKEIIDFWASEAEESLRVAKHLFEKKDYSYALFFGHLAVEKIIKAVLVKKRVQRDAHDFMRFSFYFGGYSGTPMILCVSHFIFGLLGWLQEH